MAGFAAIICASADIPHPGIGSNNIILVLPVPFHFKLQGDLGWKECSGQGHAVVLVHTSCMRHTLGLHCLERPTLFKKGSRAVRIHWTHLDSYVTTPDCRNCHALVSCTVDLVVDADVHATVPRGSLL